MKTILTAKQPIGGDGAMASESLTLDGGNLVADIRVEYPVAKLLKPVTDEIDVARDALEKVIPGDWDKAVLDPIFEGLKKAIIAKLSE